MAGFRAAAAAQWGTSPLATVGVAAAWNLLWIAGFLWRAGLPRAGWRSRPNSLTTSHQTLRCSRFWGCPQGALRQLGTYCGSQVFCGERACPALGGEAAPRASPRRTRHSDVAGFGAAHRGPLRQLGTYCGSQVFCGERACPALGGEAAPRASPRCARHTEVAGFRAAAAAQRGTSPLATGVCRLA